MQTVIKIEGMSCGHCENHVKNEMLEIAGVTSVEVSLASGSATVEHEESVTLDALKAAVVEVGFEVV